MELEKPKVRSPDEEEDGGTISVSSLFSFDVELYGFRTKLNSEFTNFAGLSQICCCAWACCTNWDFALAAIFAEFTDF